MNPKRKQKIVDAKWRICAFHYLHTSKDGAVIAHLAQVNARKLYNYSLTENWITDIRFWCPDYHGEGVLSGEFFLYTVRRHTTKKSLKRKATKLRNKAKSVVIAIVSPKTPDMTAETRVAMREKLYKEQAGICNGCRVHFPLRNMTLDHIHPKSRGGTDAPENLQVLCSTCNRAKGTISHALFLKKLRLQGVLQSEEV